MIRISFRQSMLAGFVLVVVLLGGATVQSWWVVERFVAESRRGGEQALQLTTSIQELGDRTIDVERSARQFLVLDEAALLQRFDEHLAHSLAAVDRLEGLAAAPLLPLLGQWRRAAAAVSDGLHGLTPTSDLTPWLSQLTELNGLLSQAGRRWIADQNARMLGDLDRNRLRLTAQVAAAVLGSLLVALAMGWWLVRPIRRLEHAIERLGENRFDQPVEVRGPADLRQVGRRLDWLRQRLATLEADRERSLRHVSHELKTPLTALREGIALLQEQVVGQLGPAQQEVADILEHNVVTLQRQIEGLLHLNGAAFEARRLRHRPVVLRQLLAAAVGSRELQFQARRLRVEIEAPAVTVRLDADKMRVVLDNLLSNAADFSPEGGAIRLQAAVIERGVLIDCIDQGPGVAVEDAERIFEPFVRGRRPAPTPRQGSGVGLSIVREHTAAMGGRAVLLSGDNGAHFRVEVPDER